MQIKTPTGDADRRLILPPLYITENHKTQTQLYWFGLDAKTQFLWFTVQEHERKYEVTGNEHKLAKLNKRKAGVRDDVRFSHARQRFGFFSTFCYIYTLFVWDVLVSTGGGVGGTGGRGGTTTYESHGPLAHGEGGVGRDAVQTPGHRAAGGHAAVRQQGAGRLRPQEVLLQEEQTEDREWARWREMRMFD